VCLDFLLIQLNLHIGASGHRLLLIAVKNRARMRRPLDADQCFPKYRGLEYSLSQKKKNARFRKEATTWFWVLGGQAVQSDFTVFREHIAEAWCDGQTTPDPLCATAMQEFFRLKAEEGNSGFAIAYALTLAARTNRKRSSPRSRSNVRPHAKIVVLSEEVSDEQHRRAFELEACTPGDD
jgi:hypothetical protein